MGTLMLLNVILDATSQYKKHLKPLTVNGGPVRRSRIASMWVHTLGDSERIMK